MFLAVTHTRHDTSQRTSRWLPACRGHRQANSPARAARSSMAAARPLGPALLLLLLLSLMLRLAAGAERSNTERDALRAFRAGVSDPSGALGSWNSTAHFCRWTGVACTDGHLTSLSLRELGLTGTISPAIGNLTHLESLDLNRNQLSGTIPATIGRLRRLAYLGLCDNVGVGGAIPAGLRNCTGLAVLYLNNNSLTGAVPAWLGTALPDLAYLYLSHNSFSGAIPPSLSNLTKLQQLLLGQNLLEGTIPEGLSRLPSLQVFDVYQNSLQGEIPPGFFAMPSLQQLYLANNAFHGRLPPDAGASLPALQSLVLGGNNLSGPIPASLAKATGLAILSLANNSFSGQVPPEIGTLCPHTMELSGNRLTAAGDEGWEFLRRLTNCSKLVRLSLDGNKFSGTMPSSIGNLSKQLQTLGLGSNRISGPIPPGIGNLAALQQLRLESNRLTGAIPDAIGNNLKNLTELSLKNNRLTGPLPSSIGNLTQLLKIDLSSNALNGSIPASLSNLQQLTMLNLSGNALTGHVPRQIFNLPSLSSAMDLSDNQLDGPLPSDVSRLVNLAQLTLSGNRFSGEVPEELENCQSLEFLDLDRNFFDGSVPASLGQLKGLRRLNLASNRLSGTIPPELAQLSGLQQLLLSRNGLSGTLPVELENVTSLVELDVSYNHLDGRVPLHGVFANLTGLAIAGNAALCGGVPRLELPRCPAARDCARRARLLLLLQIVVPVLSLTLFLAVLLGVFLCCYKRRPGQAKTAAPDVLDGENYSYQRISYAELAKATNGFADANLIGSGKFGTVYLGTLPLKLKGDAEPENTAVAVKVLDLRQAGASKTFVSECEALRSVRHRNLIRVVTCCASVDASGDEFRALVFEFMPNYSLDRWLHPKPDELKNVSSLSVSQRLGVAVDIADALSYLHGGSVPPIVHCDLKPSNVLLGEDMAALIGDFGLAKLLLEPGSHDARGAESTIGVRGTIGYVAPEYGTTGKVTTQGDVYSFGITLLEIFTGRSPTDGAFKDGQTLLEFVAASFPDKIEEVIDPALLPVKGFDGEVSCGSGESGAARVSVHDCLVSAVRVGLSCARAVPNERMSMTAAAAELRAIRDACVRSGGEP